MGHYVGCKTISEPMRPSSRKWGQNFTSRREKNSASKSVGIKNTATDLYGILGQTARERERENQKSVLHPKAFITLRSSFPDFKPLQVALVYFQTPRTPRRKLNSLINQINQISKTIRRIKNPESNSHWRSGAPITSFSRNACPRFKTH